MPSSGLISPSPLLAPKGQLMKHNGTAVLLLSVVVLLAANSCEARGLPVHGKVLRSTSKSHRLPGRKVGIIAEDYYAWLDVAAATSLKADGWLQSRQMEARHMMAAHQQADAKEEGMKMAAAAASAGEVRPTPTPAVTVSQRLSLREDTGFHLDYAGPRTHTPSHN